MRIALIGNCQVQSLLVAANLLLEGADIVTFDYSYPYSRVETNRRDFADTLGNYDFIFAQTALLSHTSEKDLRPRYGDKLVTIANFYFRGLFPDSCYIGDFEHRLENPTSLNSIIVLDAFLRGLSQAEALKSFNIETLERLHALESWSSSMAEMRLREANRVVDVPAADFMEDACRRFPAFLTINHPTFRLLAEYLMQVFRTAGLRFSRINPLNIRDPLAHHDTTPILDEVADHYRLPYRTTQRWKINSLDQRFISREEYIDAFYDSYATCSPRHLVVHSPTDMVENFRSHPHLAYLLDGGEGYRAATVAQADIVGRERSRVGRHVSLGIEPVLSRIKTSADKLQASVQRLADDADGLNARLDTLGNQLAPAPDQPRHDGLGHAVHVRRRMRQWLLLGSVGMLTVVALAVRSLSTG